MYTGVTEVHATDDHKLILIFDNNERRLFDMAPYLHVGRFAELKNIEVFKQISISFDTVEWENGLDLDPEFLYARSDRMLESAPTGQRNGEESGDASGVGMNNMAHRGT